MPPDQRIPGDIIDQAIGAYRSMELYRFAEYHGDRCAMCGKPTPGRRVVASPCVKHLVIDHEHADDGDARGFVRGLLCRTCNSRESLPKYGTTEVFDLYRARFPASILRLRVEVWVARTDRGMRERYGLRTWRGLATELHEARLAA